MKKITVVAAILLVLLLCACAAPQQPAPAPTSALPAADPTAALPEPTDALPEPVSPLWEEVDPTQPISADLDEDGETETIRIQIDEEAYTTLVTLTEGDETYTKKLDNAFAFPKCHIGDAITGDGCKELFLTGDAASADFYTEIFRLRDGELACIELFGTVLGVDGNGSLAVESVVDVLGTYSAKCAYRLQPDFSLERSSDYEILYSGDATERAITVKKDGLPAIRMREGAEEAVKLNAGTQLILRATDGETYAELETADSEHDRIRLEMSRDAEIDWQWYIGGIGEQEWFETLLYAG